MNLIKIKKIPLETLKGLKSKKSDMDNRPGIYFHIIIIMTLTISMLLALTSNWGVICESYRDL